MSPTRISRFLGQKRLVCMRNILAVLLLCLAAIPCLGDECPSPWGYTGDKGPAYWGKFSEVCATGVRQSPININSLLKDPVKLPSLVLGGDPTKFKVKNTGHDLKIYPDGKLTLEGFPPAAATLSQFHIHVPAEHLDNGVRHAAEIHFVYELGDRIFAIAVWIKRGPADRELQKIANVKRPPVCDKSELSDSTIDIKKLLKGRSHYAAYEGSLTTPPCSENVTFLILLDPITATATQIRALTVEPVPPGNARPLVGMKWRR